MKLSKTEDRGGAALRLASRALELVVTTSVGPRVVELRSRAGRAGNLFLQRPPDEPRAHGYLFRGGHRLWHSPEDIVRTYQPDDAPLAVQALRGGGALTQPTEQKTGLQKAMAIELLGERTVKVTHRLTNRDRRPVECAPWALTMLRPSGYGVLPLAAQKLGITNYPGWSAYWLDGTTFVKSARVLSGARYPDLGCCFETFTNGEMIEFETLGPLASIAPGKSATHVEFWTVLDGLPKPDTDAAFANSLAPAAKAWQAKLQ